MARRRYLVAYDIAHPVRLRHVAKIVEAFGDRVQYSVFLCDLSVAEKRSLQLHLRDTIEAGVDRVMFVDLGDRGSSGGLIEQLGRPSRLPVSGPTIV